MCDSRTFPSITGSSKSDEDKKGYGAATPLAITLFSFRLPGVSQIHHQWYITIRSNWIRTPLSFSNRCHTTFNYFLPLNFWCFVGPRYTHNRVPRNCHDTHVLHLHPERTRLRNLQFPIPNYVRLIFYWLSEPNPRLGFNLISNVVLYDTLRSMCSWSSDENQST